MNQYLDGQVLNIIITVKTFRAACKMAVTKDDGTIGKQEAKAIKRINAACDRFIKEVQKANQ